MYINGQMFDVAVVHYIYLSVSEYSKKINQGFNLQNNTYRFLKKLTKIHNVIYNLYTYIAVQVKDSFFHRQDVLQCYIVQQQKIQRFYIGGNVYLCIYDFFFFYSLYVPKNKTGIFYYYRFFIFLLQSLVTEWQEISKYLFYSYTCVCRLYVHTKKPTLGHVYIVKMIF